MDVERPSTAFLSLLAKPDRTASPTLAASLSTELLVSVILSLCSMENQLPAGIAPPKKTL